MKVALAVTVGASLIGYSACAAPDKVLYELQEKCGRSAAAVFDRDNPEGATSVTPDGHTTATFENHYNANLKKCFVIYIQTFFAKDSVKMSMTIFDINENKHYGEFFGHPNGYGSDIDVCYVQDSRCKSQVEWRNFVQQYMEN
jgi:hypothetical protein